MEMVAPQFLSHSRRTASSVPRRIFRFLESFSSSKLACLEISIFSKISFLLFLSIADFGVYFEDFFFRKDSKIQPRLSGYCSM